MLKPTLDPRDTWMLSYVSVPSMADSQSTGRKLSECNEPTLPTKPQEYRETTETDGFLWMPVALQWEKVVNDIIPFI